MTSTIIGIDLGTTSVKICVLDSNTKVIQEHSRPHNATRVDQKVHEQDPMKICETAFDQLKKCKLERIDKIVVSGQMHGVVLWEHESMKNFEVGRKGRMNCSNLITWMDQRCGQEFLRILPKWLPDNDGEAKISTGYGLATLAWLQRNHQLDPHWNRCGTIMDFFISLVTKSDDVYISDQNAYSWGYVKDEKWTILDRGDLFPVGTLPKIVPSFDKCFTSKTNFCGMTPETKVYVGLGDLQASIFPFVRKSQAVLNLGTSSQLVFMADKEKADEIKGIESLMTIPFFDDKVLVVAASLNGGNAIECFASQVQSWAGQISQKPIEPGVNFDLINSMLDEEPSSNTLKINSIFYGERHRPDVTASVQNWSADVSLKEFIQSIAKGIVQNLSAMMPPEVLEKFGMKRIALVGQATRRTYVSAVNECYPKCEISLCRDASLSGAYGAAIACIKYTN